MTNLSIIFSLLILFCLFVAGFQNNAPLQIEFAWWNLQMSLAATIFWSAVAGAAIIALLSLPKLAQKVLEARRLRKEVKRLEKLCTGRTEEQKGS